jgi:hypothetical protein
MTEIPKDKISCKICKYRGESPISGTCEGCNYFSKFEIDYDKVCKWCYNPVAPDDNICAEHRKSHAAHSCPGCIVEDQKKQFAAHEIAEKKARRERIATALMAGLFANAGMASITDKACADMAVIGADSLIAALDEVKE